MTQTNQTNQSSPNPVQKLAVVECDCLRGWLSEHQKVTGCSTCHGTGKKYWQLWRECPGVADEWEDTDYEVEAGQQYSGDINWQNIGPVTVSKDYPCTKDNFCLQCGGTGYVLRPEAEWIGAMTDIIHEKGWDLKLWKVKEIYHARTGGNGYPLATGTGDNYLEALAEAIYIESAGIQHPE